MKLKNIIKIAVLVPAIVACDDMFEPGIENNQDFETLTKIPQNATGLMTYGYDLPYQGADDQANGFSDVATDDAVSNNDNDYKKVGNGLWSSKKGGVNPFDRWTKARTNIQYVNRFLDEMDGFHWAGIKVVDDMFREQLTGEAHAVRAMQMFYFLRTYAGYAGNDLLGVPCLTKSETAGDDFNVPRASFKECVEQIFSDLEIAQQYLPYDYVDIKDAQLPQRYREMGVTNAEDYNRVFGAKSQGRVSGRIAQAVAAQVALFAASPAYSDQSGVTWEDAAKRAALLIDAINGVSGLDANGNHWYCNIDEIRDIRGGRVPAEIIWRDNVGENNTLETACYPSSLFGRARVNPTQNLVDAFPMANGYPITESASGYDPQNPYEGRDPRFDLYIVHDGSDFGPYKKDSDYKPINTSVDDNKNIDGLDNAQTTDPTRTGYYMRKLLNEDCIIKAKNGASGISAQHHYTARIRYTEIFLAYAEAANEAYGPTSGAASSTGCSAYDVVKAIRQRGGIENDEYLESIKSDKDKMRDLIRNERRIELCFEGHRFWDLRRWKANLNEQVKAMRIETINGKKTYTVVDVKNETRNYDDCMYYGPLPETELNKWSALKQNDGWEKF